MANIKNAIRNMKFKSGAMVLFGLFIVSLISNIMVRSYSHYHTESSPSLVVQATADLSLADITLKIFMQNRVTSGTSIGQATSGYTQIYYIPTVHYTYNSSKTVCTSGLTVSFDSVNKKFNISASNRGVCSVYFDADGVFNPDQVLRVFVYDSNKGTYYENGGIPADGRSYAIQSSLTSCTGTTPSFSISNGNIVYTASGDFKCSVYVKAS